MGQAAKHAPVTILLLLLPLVGWSQRNISGANQAFQKAGSLCHAARFDSSNIYYGKAAHLFQKAGAWKKQATCFYKLSLNHLTQSNLDLSSQNLEKAFSIHRNHQLSDTLFQIQYNHQKGKIAEGHAEYDQAIGWHQKGLNLANSSTKDYINEKVRLIISIGDVRVAQGDYEKAIQQFKQAAELYHRNGQEDLRLLSRLYNSYGMAYKDKGEWKTAKRYFQKSYDLDKKTLSSPHPELASANNNLAIIYYYQSDYQHALDHMKNAVSVLAEFYGENHQQVAAGYNNLGVVYSMTGELEKAVDYLKRALNVKKIILGKNHPDIAIGYMNLGATYSDMGKYDQAIKNYKISESITLKHFPEGHPELADIYANLGDAYVQKGAYEKALNYYHKDLNINLNLLDDNHPFIGDTYAKIGETYAQQENYKMALKFYQRSLAIIVKDFSEENGFQNPSLEKIVYPELLLQVLELKGDALKGYFNQNGNQILLDQSLQTYLQAVQLIDKLQHSFNREESKFLLREKTIRIYKKGLETAFELYQKTRDPDYKEYAFYFSEKSRSQILLSQIQQLNAQEIAQIPDSLIAYEHALRSRLTKLNQQLSGFTKAPQEKDSLNRIAIQDSMFRAQKKLENHIKNLESAYPKYYKLKYAPISTRATEIQQNLISPQQTILSYFFGQNDLFVFVISESSFDIRKLPADSLLKKDVRAFRQSIQKTHSVASFAKESYDLYRQLIIPVADLISGKQLLIIPDGILHYLPFESLVSRNFEKIAEKRFQDLPYLVNRYAVGYAPSTEYLQLYHQQTPAPRQKQFVGFAPVFSSVTSTQERNLTANYERPLSALPLSKKEVGELETLFNDPTGFWSFLKSPKEEAQIFTENKASEYTFKNLPLKSYRYIHLATHAFILEEHPKKSGILFAPSQKPGEDGILHASEIYNLQLNAELVTLSACNTGIGSLARGEGMMSLSRAFQYAGAKNLLVSLWRVDDRSTARLMIDFYEKNKEENNMAGALRNAKKTMIQESRYAHPKYWAPFIFIGQ